LNFFAGLTATGTLPIGIGSYLILDLFAGLSCAVVLAAETAIAAAAALPIKLRRDIFLRLFISVLLKLTFIVTAAFILHLGYATVFLQTLTIKGKDANLHSLKLSLKFLPK